jgi:hypothetical protein
MRARLIPATGFGWCACVLVLLAGGWFSGQAAEMKLQAFLLWGTNESKPPADKPYNPAPLDIQQKLKDLPLKWTNWFEVNRKECVVPHFGTREVPMSAKCQLNVKGAGGAEIEVSLIGKGKEVVRQKQALPRGEMLVLGGNAPNSTCWLVVLKRIE